MRQLLSFCLCLLICTGALAAEAPAEVPGQVLQEAVAQESAGWARTLTRIAQSVVSIKVDQTRAFDTEWNSSAQATGFVVDAARGLILTNRHVVTPGPVTAEAIFLNREEVQLRAVYRDPVHDFGIYRYDPAKLRFIHPESLPLYPEGARIGREIRVIGNNAGEQLSILAGTLARLDRDAPDYGIGKYNDFNTFYLQAASGTSGGSSGSPVVDIQGRVIALNAGGATGAASSFYLPLDRVKRALELIQAGEPVPRGTLQARFAYTPYDELKRLGLDGRTEAAVRNAFPAVTGMLVVAEVQPGSPAEKVLQPGDVLIKVNERYITQFEPLADILDGSVGKPVQVLIERGGRVVDAAITVSDLHGITPDEYLEVGDGIVHTLSYQQARHFNLPVAGVYVANPGYIFGAAGVPRGAVIRALDGTQVPGLDAFVEAVSKLGQGERALVRYSTIDDPASIQVASLRMDWRWFATRRCHRDDATGLWPCTDLAAPADKAGVASGGSTTFPKYTDAKLTRIAPSLVGVTFDMPYSIAGITEKNYYGTGVIADAARGLVVVDRNTVPVSLGDARLTFAGSLEIPARVVFVHPLHNLAVLQYDPALIGSTPVRSARLATRPLRIGDAVNVVGLSRDGEIKQRATTVADIESLDLPLSRTMQFRDSNLEVIQLLNAPQEFDGVIVDRGGAVAGLWSSFAYEDGRDMQQQNRGVAIELVADMLSRVEDGGTINSLEAEFSAIALAAARRFGLSDEWLARLSNGAEAQRRVLIITRLVGSSPAQQLLQQGDLLLSIDDKVISSYRGVETAVADRPRVKVTVWRDGAELTLEVPTVALTGDDFDKVLLWAGATLHAPHRAMIAQRGTAAEGVYVAYFSYGSPASRYGLYPGRRITELDGVPTPDLDSFIKLLRGRADRSSVRLKTITWNNAAEVITLKLDEHYWPAYLLTRTKSGWQRQDVE
ncbi:MAG: PDZ domain-containing protein [Steroidobacteraceae bacterium]